MNRTTAHWNNLNLIRLIAALQVLLVHGFNHFEFEGALVAALKLVPGVPAFFFISGLLISASYARTCKLGFRAFYGNRALRIFPALWICVGASVLMVWVSGYLQSRQISTGHFILWIAGQLSFVQFYNPEFMRTFGVGVLNGVLWTISVELQFYVITPVLYYLMQRQKMLFGLIIVASLALNVYFRVDQDWSRMEMKLVYTSFLPWVYMFMLGFLVAGYREQFDKLFSRTNLIALLMIYVLSMVFIGSYKLNASNAINPLSFCILAVCIVKLSNFPIPILDQFQKFISKNDFSYGLYLYHMPVLNALLYFAWFRREGSLIVLVLLSFFAAVCSWFFVERPSLRFKS
jgi:peptidoglycan/LPS O-acetylase OafA/YrhL